MWQSSLIHSIAQDDPPEESEGSGSLIYAGIVLAILAYGGVMYVIEWLKRMRDRDVRLEAFLKAKDRWKAKGRFFLSIAVLIGPFWYWAFYKLSAFLHAVGREVSSGGTGSGRHFTIALAVLCLCVPLLCVAIMWMFSNQVYERYDEHRSVLLSVLNFAFLFAFGFGMAYMQVHPDYRFPGVQRGTG